MSARPNWIAFDHRLDEFRQRLKSSAYRLTPRFTQFLLEKHPDRKKGGIGRVQYPLVADVKHEICRAYDVEFEGCQRRIPRPFLIDKNGVVRHQVVNDLPLGRNVDEMLRMVDALQIHRGAWRSAPAGWMKERKA